MFWEIKSAGLEECIKKHLHFHASDDSETDLGEEYIKVLTKLQKNGSLILLIMRCTCCT